MPLIEHPAFFVSETGRMLVYNTHGQLPLRTGDLLLGSGDVATELTVTDIVEGLGFYSAVVSNPTAGITGYLLASGGRFQLDDEIFTLSTDAKPPKITRTTPQRRIAYQLFGLEDGRYLYLSHGTDGLRDRCRVFIGAEAEPIPGRPVTFGYSLDGRKHLRLTSGKETLDMPPIGPSGELLARWNWQPVEHLPKLWHYAIQESTRGDGQVVITRKA